MDEHVVDSWITCSAKTLALLDAIPPEALADVPAAMRGRAVREIFAHLHNNRLAWLEPSAPDLASELAKVPAKSAAGKDALTHAVLRPALESSGAAVAEMLRARIPKGKIPGFKAAPAVFAGYLVAHEGYHWGEICMQLTQANHKLPDAVLYGLWGWDQV